jgi:hypothetical protein
MGARKRERKEDQAEQTKNKWYNDSRTGASQQGQVSRNFSGIAHILAK